MRRRVGLFLSVALVLPLAVAASASAQGSNLIITPQTAAQGQTVTASSFGGYASAAGVSPVHIRLMKRNGTILKSTAADASGSINTSFPIPPTLAPGQYLVLATQTNDANGRQRSFTPGRTRITVTAASNAAAAPGQSSGSTLPPLFWGGALALVLLLTVGSTLTARRLWTLNRPHPGN